MTCELAYDGHDCSVPLACLRAAAATLPARAEQRPRQERERRQRSREETVTIIWPDDPFWGPA